MLLKCGFGKKKITPPEGVSLVGYLGRIGNAEGVHDDLFARTMVVRSEDRDYALISVDLLFTNKILTESIRTSMEKRTSIPKKNIMISATHTHSGPTVWFPNKVDSELVPEGPVAPEWQSKLPGIAADSALKAKNKLTPVRYEYFDGKTEIGTSRRKRDPFGDIHLIPDIGNDTGTDFKVLLFKGGDGKVVGTYINTSCHPVVLAEDNLEYTADYPKYTLDRIEDEFDAPAFFTSGASGDIDPRIRGSFNKARRIGSELADDILNSYKKSRAEGRDKAAPDIKSREVSLPVDGLPSINEIEDYVSDIEELIRINGRSSATYEELLLTSPTADGRIPGVGSTREEMSNYHVKRLVAEHNYAKRRLVQLKRKKRWEGQLDFEKKQIRGEIQALKLGRDVVLVGIPGELFSALSVEIEEKSPFPNTIVVGYANGAIGYIPNRGSFEQGGYEINRGTLLAPGGGEEIVNRCVSLLNSLEEKR